MEVHHGWRGVVWSEMKTVQAEKPWNVTTGTLKKTDKTKKQRGGMRDRESRQGGRQAYHLCVGGHKLRKSKEEEEKKKKKGCKINREEAGRGREGKEKRESGQKWISGCSNLKNRTKGNRKTVDMVQINGTEKRCYCVVDMDGDPMLRT